MMSAESSLPASTLVDRAYEYIRIRILSGSWEPETPLRLQAIATAIGVSIIPVREALRRLESERLVEIQANRGARVAGLSVEDMRDAYTTRGSLEINALRRSMDRLGPDEIDRARELNRTMVRLFSEGMEEEAYALHRELHFVFYDRADSPWTLRFINVLWDHTERYRRLATKLRGEAIGIGVEHALIIDAIEGGHPDTATGALMQHLGRSLELLESPSADGVSAATR